MSRDLTPAQMRDARQVSRVTLEEDVRKRLALAVYGPHAPGDQKAESLEDLIWRAGQHRREIEDAHAWLDTHGIPRTRKARVAQPSSEQTYTVRGRLDQFEVVE